MGEEAELRMHVIAHMHCDYQEKFGIPRQSGLVPGVEGRIVFEKTYRDPNAFRGIEGFSHLWLIWQFSRAIRKTWSPMVLPPRLGGKTHVGVFATRSPFRPNPLGLSCVKLERFEVDPKDGPVLIVSGADLLDGTPIYDIKPYLAYTDSQPQAKGAYADEVLGYRLEVVFPRELLERLPVEKREAVLGILAQDPRPPYQDDPSRRYGTAFGGYDIRFHVRDGVLTVCDVVKLDTQ